MTSKTLLFAASMLAASSVFATSTPYDPQGDNDGDGIANHRDQCRNTPKSANVDGVGCPTRTTRQKQYQSAILFAQNDNQPLYDQDSKFERIIGFAKRYKNHFVLIEGYQGFNDTQLDISSERGNQVAQMLVASGVRKDKIHIADMSHMPIVVKSDTPQALAATQKVVVRIVPKQPQDMKNYQPLSKTF